MGAGSTFGRGYSCGEEVHSRQNTQAAGGAGLVLARARHGAGANLPRRASDGAAGDGRGYVSGTCFGELRVGRLDRVIEGVEVAKGVGVEGDVVVAGGDAGLAVDAREHEERVDAVGAAETHVGVQAVADHDGAGLVEAVVRQDGVHHASVGLAADGVGLSTAGKGHRLDDGAGAGQPRALEGKRRVDVRGDEGRLAVEEVLQRDAELEVRELEVEPDDDAADARVDELVDVLHRQRRRPTGRRRRLQVVERHRLVPEQLQLCGDPALPKHPHLLVLRQPEHLVHVDRRRVRRVDDLARLDPADPEPR